MDDALAGASTVVIQLRVGGQAARISDETFPLACDCVGQETTGAGGLAKALRTVPVVLDIARPRPTPGAWIVNFTNPVGIVTRALLDDGHRAAGLCNVAIGFQRRLAATLGVEPSAVVLDHVGLNHLTWERAAYVGRRRPAAGAARHRTSTRSPPGCRCRRRCCTALGNVPSYYLRYFYCHDRSWPRSAASRPAAQRVAEIEASCCGMYADPALTEKPALLGQRGGAFYSEAAVGLIASLHARRRRRARRSTCATAAPCRSSPTTRSSRSPARVGAAGADAGAGAPLAPGAGRPRRRTSAAYEELAVDAAVHGGRRPGVPGAARPPAGRPARQGRRGSPTTCSRPTATTSRGCR